MADFPDDDRILDESQEADNPRKRRRRNAPPPPRRPGDNDWLRENRQFDISDSSESSAPSEHPEPSSNYDDDEEEEIPFSSENSRHEDDLEEGSDFPSNEEDGAADAADLNEQFQQQYGLPAQNPAAAHVEEEEEEEEDHVTNCFMCLYGDRGFDRANKTHRAKMQAIMIKELNDNNLCEDDIGTQLWLYFSEVVLPELKDQADKELRPFEPPPWSLKHARIHVSRVDHPVLFLRREERFLKRLRAKMVPHVFPQEQKDDGSWTETYDKVAYDNILKTSKQIADLRSKDPRKMVGGDNTEITTQSMKALFRDGLDYTDGSNWEVK